MFKKILLTAAALSTLVLGASAANAGYGISVSYGHGYGHHHYNSYSYYQPSCYTRSRPVTIRVWDDILTNTSSRPSIATTGSATSRPWKPKPTSRLGQLRAAALPPEAAALTLCRQSSKL